MDKEWQDKQQADIMLGSAKHCWKIRMERVPPDNEITWADWFEQKYKIPLWKLEKNGIRIIINKLSPLHSP